MPLDSVCLHLCAQIHTNTHTIKNNFYKKKKIHTKLLIIVINFFELIRPQFVGTMLHTEHYDFIVIVAS